MRGDVRWKACRWCGDLFACVSGHDNVRIYCNLDCSIKRQQSQPSYQSYKSSYAKRVAAPKDRLRKRIRYANDAGYRDKRLKDNQQYFNEYKRRMSIDAEARESFLDKQRKRQKKYHSKELDAVASFAMLSASSVLSQALQKVTK